MKEHKISKTKNRKPTKKGKLKTPDDYLAALADDKRVALESLRRTIRNTIPEVEECISYGIPTFRLNGKFLVAYGAATKHCAFYPGRILATLREELKSYATGKGTIRFQAHNPLPANLVRKIVRLRKKQF